MAAGNTRLRLLSSEARTARRARAASGRSPAQRFAPLRSEHADRGRVAGAARTAPRAPTVALELLGSPHPSNVRRSHTCVAHCRTGTRPASCTIARQAGFCRTSGIVLAKIRAPRSRTSSTRAAPARRIAAGHARASRARLRETIRGAQRESLEWRSLGLVPLVAFGCGWRWSMARSVRSHQRTISEPCAT